MERTLCLPQEASCIVASCGTLGFHPPRFVLRAMEQPRGIPAEAWWPEHLECSDLFSVNLTAAVPASKAGSTFKELFIRAIE